MRAPIAGFLTALIAAGAAAGADGTPEARGGPIAQPNVLVVMTDDQRVSDLRTAMPRTKRLFARSGVTFRNAFATFPLCCPSRATYLTGQYAHNHGVVSNDPPEGSVTALDDSATIAVALDQAGYETGWIGKYLNGYIRLARDQDPPYVPPGYDHWRAASLVARMYGWEQVIGDRLKRWGHGPRDYQTDVYTRQAKRFLEASGESADPFFLTVAPFAAHREGRPGAKHDPRAAKRHERLFTDASLPRSPAFNEADVSDKPSFVRSIDRLDRARRKRLTDDHRDRLRSLAAVDDMVGALIRKLRSTGQLDDTLVIVWSDNGYALGEHRLTGKSTFYDPAAKVPLLMRGPGVPPGEKVRPLAANADLAPTILDFTGVEPLTEPDGVSLFDLIANPGDFDDRELVLQMIQKDTRGMAIRTADWLYASYETELGNEEELYDLEADPNQLRSVHETNEPMRAALAARLDDLRDCAGDECR